MMCSNRCAKPVRSSSSFWEPTWYQMLTAAIGIEWSSCRITSSPLLRLYFSKAMLMGTETPFLNALALLTSIYLPGLDIPGGDWLDVRDGTRSRDAASNHGRTRAWAVIQRDVGQILGGVPEQIGLHRPTLCDVDLRCELGVELVVLG